ncbi:LolA family protein [Aquirufa sp. ROCK2-A2]
MKKYVIIFSLLTISSFAFSQANKAISYIDGMQKKYKSMSSFAANFSYQTEGGGPMTGTITVKGNKFRLKTSGQEIFNNGKEVSTYIKEINEVNISNFDPSEGDLSPAKIYTFDKKAYKMSLISDAGSVATIELAPNAKSAQVQKISIKINKFDSNVKEWTIVNKSGKKQNFKVTKLTPNAGADDKFFSFDKKAYPGVEINDLR